MTELTRDVVTFPLWGGFATVAVTNPLGMEFVLPIVEETLAQVDLAASNYRDDSDLAKLHAANGRPVMVTPMLAAAITVAMDSAAWTNGAVDPTIGGLTRDTRFTAKRTSYREVQFDPRLSMVTLPDDVQLDLGATAKAWAADLAATRAYEALIAAGLEQIGVMIALAGDIAVAGPCEQGWSILVTDDHRTDPNAVDAGVSVSIVSGGLATSSTTTRRTKDEQGTEHAHIIDPATWRPVESSWRTVTVAAKSCTAANAASTAAIVLNDRAIEWLNAHALPARLVRHDGSVVTLNGWPTEEEHS